MKYFVYVVERDEGFRYKGITDNLERRLVEHNDKLLSFWTKRGTNWKLIYKEELESKTDALKRERWLKSGVGREYLKKVLSK